MKLYSHEEMVGRSLILQHFMLNKVAMVQGGLGLTRENLQLYGSAEEKAQQQIHIYELFKMLIAFLIGKGN